LLSYDEIYEIATESIKNFQQEMDDDQLIINAIKSSDYKQHAFERGDLDYSEIDRMGRTTSSFFFSKPEAENV